METWPHTVGTVSLTRLRELCPSSSSDELNDLERFMNEEAQRAKRQVGSTRILNEEAQVL